MQQISTNYIDLHVDLQDIQEANFRTSSSRLLAAVMSALCNTSVKLTSILPIAYDGEVLLRSLVKQVSTENDSALAHRFPLLVAHMEKLSHVSTIIWSNMHNQLKHCFNVHLLQQLQNSLFVVF